MQNNEIVLHKKFGLGIVTATDTEVTKVCFITDGFKDIHAPGEVLMIIPKDFVKAVINLDISEEKIKPYTSSYDYYIDPHDPEVLTFLLYKRLGLAYKIDMEDLDFLSRKLNKDWQTVFQTIKRDFNRCLSFLKYEDVDYDFRKILALINKYNNNYYNISYMEEINNYFSNNEFDVKKIYNLIEKGSYEVTNIIAEVLANNEKFEEIRETLKTDDPFEENTSILLFTNDYHYYSNGRFFELNFTPRRNFHSYLADKFDEILSRAMRDYHNDRNKKGDWEAIFLELIQKTNDLNKILETIKDLYNKASLPAFFSSLFKVYPYHDYRDTYIKYLKYFNSTNFNKYADQNDYLYTLTASDSDHKTILTHLEEYMARDKKYVYGALFDYYSVNWVRNVDTTSPLINDTFKEVVGKHHSYARSRQLGLDSAFVKSGQTDPLKVLELDEFIKISYKIGKASVLDHNNQPFTYDIITLYLNIGDSPVCIINIDLLKVEAEIKTANEYFDDMHVYNYAITKAHKDIPGFTKLYEDMAVEADNLENELITAYLKSEITSFNKESDKITGLTFSKDNLVMLRVSIETSREGIFLSLEIGTNNKMYVVKDLNKFLQSFTTHETKRYGKFLTFTHITSNLASPYDKIVNYLLHNFNGINSYQENKITSPDFYNIILLLEDNYIYLNNNYYKVLSERFKPEISITDGYMLIIDNLDGYQSYYVHHKFFVVNDEYHTLSLVEDTPLNNFAMKHDGEDFSLVKDDLMYNIYARYVDKIKISDELKQSLNLPEVLIKAYFDYENDRIVLSTKYEIEGLSETSDIRQYDYAHTIDRFEDYIAKLGFKNNVLSNSDAIINFLMLDFTYLKSLAEVYLSEALQNKTVTVASLPQIKMNYKSGLMDVFLEDSTYSTDELTAILKAMRKNKRYVLLKNNQILAFKEEDMKFAEVIDNLGLTNDLNSHKQVPLYQTFKNLGLYDNISTDDFINEMLNDLTNYKRLNFRLPTLNAELRNYQVDGYKWLRVLNKYHLGGILADDMGLGKTLEIISLLASIDITKPVLIVCPKSLIFNWISEINRFAENLSITKIYGTQTERKNIIGGINSNNKMIYITSYDSLLRDLELYKNTSFSYLILDEAQAIKNVLAQKSKAVKQIKADNRLALTGTPIENQLLDLWSIFDFLMPNFFPGIHDFKNNYKDEENIKSLALKVTPFILRRTKKDVLKDLPAKYETILTVELTQDERKRYDAFILEAKQMLETSKNFFGILPYLLRLRQICISSKLVDKDFTEVSSKLKALLDIVVDYISKNHKILIFSAFVEVLNLIEPLLKENNINYYMITGKTSAEDRINLVNDFNGNRKVNVFLISLKAGGVGLNLVGADTVIHVDPWWNVAAENQASDRAHRIGQVNNVEVIKLICENTVEERIIELQNMKKDLIDKVISDDDKALTSLSRDDLKFILS